MMKKIAIQAESVIDYKHEDFEHNQYSESDIDKKYLIKSAIEIAEKNNISAIITFTKS
jgi:pyruvate kinase